MDYGHSLVRNDYIHATDLAYGQCAELQVVCPACAEPLLKKGSELTKLQYLSHYASPEANCEKRVRKLMATVFNRQLTVTLPSEPTLAQFLLQFERIVMERNCRPSGLQAEVAEHHNRMRRRPTYRKIVREIRDNLRTKPEGWADLRQNLADRCSSDEERAALNQTLRFLIAANTFQAGIFAANFNIIRRWSDSGLPKPPSEWTERGGEALVEGLVRWSEREFARTWHSLKQPECDFVASEIVNCICCTADDFLYAVSSTT